MKREQRYIGSYKIDLRGKTNLEKYNILKWLKPLSTNYQGHFSVSYIERNYDLIGLNALNGFTCFSISAKGEFWAHLDDYAFVQLPYKALNLDNLLKIHNERQEQKDDFAISFLESIKDYERESGNRICEDERSSKELLEIFKNQ
jgi:hypothetical protein